MLNDFGLRLEDRRAGPLGGMVVVGLEHSVAGPLCTRILGDLGATVVKVERAEGGDFSRDWDTNVAGEGAQFWWLNRGKQSLHLDLRTPGGRDILGRLLDRADVLVSNLSPAAADRLGLTSDEFGRRYRQLVACQISGYGLSGPFRNRKAYDMLIQAEAGVMSVTGSPDTPMRTGVSLIDVGTGIYAAALVLGALIERQATGSGRRLDVAMFDTAIEFLGPMLISYLNSGVVYPRIPDRHHAIAPYGVYECADGGRVLIAIHQDSEWRKFCENVLGDAPLANNIPFRTNTERIANHEAVDEMVQGALSRLTTAEALTLFDELGFGYGKVNDMQEVAQHPAFASLGVLTTAESSSGTSVAALVGIAERLFGLAPNGGTRPPDLGEHTDSIVRELLATESGEWPIKPLHPGI